MGTITQQFKYFCDYDCERGGCKGHIAKLSFNSIVNIYSFDDDNGSKCLFDNSSMNALVKMLKIFSQTRADTVDI